MHYWLGDKLYVTFLETNELNTRQNWSLKCITPAPASAIALMIWLAGGSIVITESISTIILVNWSTNDVLICTKRPPLCQTTFMRLSNWRMLFLMYIRESWLRSMISYPITSCMCLRAKYVTLAFAPTGLWYAFEVNSYGSNGTTIIALSFHQKAQSARFGTSASLLFFRKQERRKACGRTSWIKWPTCTHHCLKDFWSACTSSKWLKKSVVYPRGNPNHPRYTLSRNSLIKHYNITTFS